MTEELLTDRATAAYVGARRDQPEALWFFLHIPKTAGSSFRAELANRLQPDANIFITYDDPSATHEQLLARAMSGFLGSLQATQPRFASGHLYRSHVEQLRQHRPDVKLITMLRDPVARLISDYRYQRTPAHPPYRQFIEAFPDFASYLACKPEQNKMHHYLSRYTGQPVEEVIEEVEREFTFVGTQELYEFSCRLLFTLLGRLEAPLIYARKTEANEQNRVDEGAVLRDEIEAANSLDVQIYRHFAARLESLRNTIEAGLPPFLNPA